MKDESNYKIRRTWINGEGVLMCSYVGEWDSTKLKGGKKK